MKNIAEEPCGQGFHLRACKVLPEKRVWQMVFLIWPFSARRFFYGSLEVGVGRGSGEARVLSDTNVKKRHVMVNGLFQGRNPRNPVETQAFSGRDCVITLTLLT